MCRDTGELIAWECGDRDKATLEKARLEGLTEGLSEAQKKHEEWGEWAKNGQDKPQPKPPKAPETDQ